MLLNVKNSFVCYVLMLRYYNTCNVIPGRNYWFCLAKKLLKKKKTPMNLKSVAKHTVVMELHS